MQDDEALIASLISCAAGNESHAKKAERQMDFDEELVAALAAEACPRQECDTRYCVPLVSLWQVLAAKRAEWIRTYTMHHPPLRAVNAC